MKLRGAASAGVIAAAWRISQRHAFAARGGDDWAAARRRRWRAN